MRTITYLILFHFLLFNLFTSFFYAYASEVKDHEKPEAIETAELVGNDQPTPTDIPAATHEAQLEATSEATITATPEATVETGDATTEIIAETEINRNVVGTNNCFVLLNLYKNPDFAVDLANIVPTDCNDHAEATNEGELDIVQENTATIQNTIQANTNTGNNTASHGTAITTGDATTSAYLSTIANTNIVGSNTLFGVLNIFSPTSQDIILPYELSFLQGGDTTPLPYLTVTNINNNIVENNINADANTGGNKGERIQTGNTTVLIRVADTANTNIFQSGFLVLHLNVLAPWNGTVQNFNGNSLQSLQNTLSNQPDSTAISNTNETRIQNNLDLKAETGNNRASKGDISTGNATIKAFISTIANTNIVGNNWYHMIVNIFDKFDGNIIFPRPDLVTGMFAKSVGENEAEITVRYANGGTYEGHDVQILTHLPTEAAISSYSGDAQLDGPRIYWNVGTLHKNEIGERTFRIHLEKPGVYTISTSISTSTDEPNKQNNGSHTTITVQEPIKVQPTPLKQNSLMKPLPNIAYSRNVQSPSRVTKIVVNKLNLDQLRSTPGQTLGVTKKQPITHTRSIISSSFPMMTIYIFSVLWGVIRLFGN